MARFYIFAVAYTTKMSKKSGFDLEDRIGYLLFKGHRAMANQLHNNLRKKGLDITPEQWMLLVHLWKDDGLNQNALAKNCGRDKTTITRAIDNLEKMDMVMRVKSKIDARIKHIYLTEKAKSLKETAIPVIDETIEQAQKGIGIYDLEITKETLKKIYKNLSPYEAVDE